MAEYDSDNDDLLIDSPPLNSDEMPTNTTIQDDYIPQEYSALSIFPNIQKNKIKYAQECIDLYLSNKHIGSVQDLELFPYITSLFLNNNLLKIAPVLQYNFRLKELFLNNNEIEYIPVNAFKTLKVLTRLTLNNNFVVNIHTTLHEIKPLKTLKYLDLYNNPIFYEEGYKHTIISTLPQVEMLDRKAVTVQDQRDARAYTTKSNNNNKTTTILPKPESDKTDLLILAPETALPEPEPIPVIAEPVPEPPKLVEKAEKKTKPKKEATAKKK